MRLGITILASCVLLCLCRIGVAADISSPVGYWKTIDDVTHQPRSIFEIKQTADNSLVGRVIKSFPQPGEPSNRLCEACTGDRHNKPILGMVLMQSFKKSAQAPNRWIEGRILDPLSGKTYHCNLTVLDGGRQLVVRGYIGMPLFGRSQTWLRVTKPDQ